VAAALADLADLVDVIVLHDRRARGTGGNIDHIVIAPGGIFVVDAKAHKGGIRIRDKGGLFRSDKRLYVGGHDRSDLADNMGWQVTAVETALLSAGPQEARVTSVLCFLHAEWPLLFPPDTYKGVRLESPRSLKKLITGTHVLDAGEIDRLARVLATAFPTK